ncbi:peroxiredoxin [Gramella sp. GC03-9]|uniref:thioredoxin-dependent peroxiredoxin n=1 Tax=Christiangramia oceanisediminis TaxID=2920386 RepID=A0A9X2KZN9_9FLAO|nr:peroxiredoxin [Gramella oceanisediminis]MCP9201156.1 peroxiredoxin [Gramella oceanisediminis]
MKLGDKIPTLTLKDQDGREVDLRRKAEGNSLVVFFYPKDFTPGCTKEACSFRDSYEEFRDLGAEVIGISSDSEDSHSNFSKRYNLPYPILSDRDKKARNAFNVKPSLLGLLPGRETFIFNDKAELIHKFNSMSAGKHIPEALAVLKRNQ